MYDKLIMPVQFLKEKLKCEIIDNQSNKKSPAVCRAFSKSKYIHIQLTMMRLAATSFSVVNFTI